MTPFIIRFLASAWETTDGNKRLIGVALVVAGLAGHSLKLITEEDARMALGAGISILAVGAAHYGHKKEQVNGSEATTEGDLREPTSGGGE